MPPLDLLRHRLHNQHLTRPRFATPAELVAWFGAVQAQDYFGARWAVGQRLSAATDATVEAAFDAGEILRTHAMRPTWHFVAPADLRWLQRLTGHRVHRFNGSLYRQHALDEPVFKRAHKVLEKTLRDGQHKTRAELDTALQAAGIERDGVGLAHIVMHAELEGLICSGPRRGKQFTYALLEERVPPAPALTQEEALAELTRRYLQSHGPAQVHDMAWWSGLTVGDVKKGIALLGDALMCQNVGGKDYWYFPGAPPPIPARAFLLPNYDEYGIAYKDRSALDDPLAQWQPAEAETRVYAHLIVHQGRVIGLWRREIAKDHLVAKPRYLHPPSAAEQRAVAAAARQYADFLGQPVVLEAPEQP